MLFELNRSPWPLLRREALLLIKLALPMMVAQIAQVATGFVDTVMAGRVSTGDLAAVSLGASVFITVYVTLIGVAGHGSKLAVDLPRLFDPTFSTKSRGSGMGLAAARRAVEEHGGRLVAERSARGGLRIGFVLPAAAR